jgi:uncharacterized protein (UPF0371 family)
MAIRRLKPMAAKTGFDNEKYLEQQSAAILERVKKYDNKLYLEFGGIRDVGTGNL